MADLFTPTAIIVGMLNYHAAFTPAASQISVADVKCMADNIYFEAQTQISRGQRAVAHVTLNRVKNPKFPNTICGVVKQGLRTKSGFPRRNRCHFSWFCDGKSDKIYLTKRKGRKAGQVNARVFNAYSHAVQQSIAAILGWSKDPTYGATYYYAHKLVYPRWAKKFKRLIIIQEHTFMRPYIQQTASIGRRPKRR